MASRRFRWVRKKAMSAYEVQIFGVNGWTYRDNESDANEHRK
jgi:hypothetical protein